MKTLLLLLLITSINIAALARVTVTIQEEDLIIVDGARYFTQDFPPLDEAMPNAKIPKFIMLTTAN